MDISKCEKCKYYYKRFKRDRYGNFSIGYYSCNCPPHWGADINNVMQCPKTFTQRDIDNVARRLNGR